MIYIPLFFSFKLWDNQTTNKTDDNRDIPFKTSYFNNSMTQISINGDSSNDWEWAADQPWCSEINNIYYVENLTINAQNSDNCIEIRDSEVEFVIKNCTLYNASGSHAGIYLDNVSNSKILNKNISFNNEWGIFLTRSNNNTISNNVLTIITIQSVYFLNYCGNNTISHNILKNSNHGVYFNNFCNNNTIYNNTIENTDGYGIRIISNSNYNKILENNFKECDMAIELSIGNKSIISNNNITECSTGIRVINSHYNNITMNKIMNGKGTGHGCDISTSSNNKISYNTMINCPSNGIFLSNCNRSLITNNYINNNNNREGLRAQNSYDNIISLNNITFNAWHGILLSDSSQNITL